MATFDRQDIIAALTRLGELASAQGDHVKLTLMGGALMVLLFGERTSTRDVDVSILAPSPTAKLRAFAQIVAAERGWPADWINDAAKGYLIGRSEEAIVFSSAGITVTRPSFAQLLAMKLCAWRDELDIADARRLLLEVSGNREQVWKEVSPFLLPGSELKAQYALEDLWDSKHANN